MCLSKVWKVYQNPSRAEVAAWGIFKIRRGRVLFQYQKLHRRRSVPRRRWLQAQGRGSLRSALGIGIRYPFGFHKYVSRVAAQARALSGETVLPVRLRNLVAIGKQSNRKVYVAKEMFVP